MRAFAVVVLLLSLGACALTTDAKAGSHSDGCSRAGDAAGINCQLRRWVHCRGKRVTSFNAHGRRYCPGHYDLPMIATKHPVCGQTATLTNENTGQSATVVVADKGPATIAVYDLSHEAARALGIHGSGCVF